MKASWSGYLSLGRLNIPVKLFSAVKNTAPRFVQVHAKDKSPIKRILTCQKEGKEIASDEMVRAAEYDGHYVEISDSELERARPTTKNIIVHQFSETTSISSIYYEKPYFIVPGKGGEMAYTLLRQAFDRTKKAAVVTYLMYDKDHLGLVIVHDGLLLLQQLRFADEIVSRNELQTPTLPQPTPANVDVVTKLMERYSAPFYIEDYRNEQQADLQQYIERKAKGLPPKRAEITPAETTPEDRILPMLNSMLSDDIGQTLLE